jgi:hypothetical protein
MLAGETADAHVTIDLSFLDEKSLLWKPASPFAVPVQSVESVPKRSAPSELWSRPGSGRGIRSTRSVVPVNSLGRTSTAVVGSWPRSQSRHLHPHRRRSCPFASWPSRWPRSCSGRGSWCGCHWGPRPTPPHGWSPPWGRRHAEPAARRPHPGRCRTGGRPQGDRLPRRRGAVVLNDDPLSGDLFVFRSRRPTSSRSWPGRATGSPCTCGGWRRERSPSPRRATPA